MEGQGIPIFVTRRREYYNGERRRRRTGRRLLGVLAHVAVAIAAVGGVAAMGGLPAISLPGTSGAPIAVATTGATSEPAGSQPPASSPGSTT